MQKHTFSIQLGSGQQSGTTSTQICNLKVIRTQRQGNQFSSLEMSSQTATTAETTEAIAGLQMCSRGALVLLPSRPEQVYNPQLEVLAFSSRAPCSTCGNCSHPPASLRWPCLHPAALWHPGKCLHTPCSKKVRCRGWLEIVWAGKDLPHLSTLPAGALEKGMGLFGGFSSGLSWIPLITTGQRQNILTKEIIESWQLLQ